MRALLFAVPLAGMFACQSTTRVATDGSSAPPPPAAPAATPAAALPAPAPKTRPTDKAGCDACKGLWARHGIAEAESCICKTKDGGKACRDGDECEGACIVSDDAKFEVVKPGNPPRGHFVGRCADYDTTFGCYRLIPKERRTKGELPEEEAAPRLCVD
jgi:hypothetical protein